jgi:hypothetical protein
LLDHLHHAPDFAFERTARNGGRIETHHAGAHAVDQHARRVLQRAEEFGFGDGHAQHGHLQPRKPYARRKGNAFLREDGLKHERHDFDRGLVGGGGCPFLDFGAAPPQIDRGLLDDRGLLPGCLHVLRGGHPVGGFGICDHAREGLGKSPRSAAAITTATSASPGARRAAVHSGHRLRRRQGGRHVRRADAGGDKALEAQQRRLRALASEHQRRAARRCERGGRRESPRLRRGSVEALPLRGAGGLGRAAGIGRPGHRCRSAGGAGAPHETLEIDFRHHPPGDQERVGIFIGLDDHADQLLLHGVLHARPEHAAQAGREPLVHQQLGQRLGPEHVVGVQFAGALEVLDAQPQVAELETGLVVDHLRQARRKNVAFHHVVADQLEPQPPGGRRSGRRTRGTHRLAPTRLGERHPLRGLALKRHEVVAALLHGASAADFRSLFRQAVPDGLRQRNDDALGGQNETLTRLACELLGRGGPRNTH